MPGTSAVLYLEARAAEDFAGAGVDVDPHHLRSAHELQPVAAGKGVELRSEVDEAVHARHDALLEVAQRHEAAGLAAAERLVLLAFVRTRVGEGAGEDDAEGGDKGKETLHVMVSACSGEGIGAAH